MKRDRIRAAAARFLLADAFVVILAGLFTLVAPGSIAGWLGLSGDGDVRLAAIGIVVYGVLLAGHVLYRGASRWLLVVVGALNALWVLLSAAVLLNLVPGFEDARWIPVIAQGAIVGLFAIGQARLVRAWQ
jgi:hypothetical protein